MRRWLVGLGSFCYDFVVGDDWTVAMGVIVALIVTWLLARTHNWAWVVVPAAVLVLLGISILRARSSATVDLGPEPTREDP